MQHPLETLVRENWDRITNFAFTKSYFHQQDAEDILAEAIAKAYLAWDRVKPTKPLSWIFRIVQTTAIDFHRKKSRQTVELKDVHATLEWQDPNWKKDHIDLILYHLPLQYTNILVLKYVHEKTNSEIAEELNIKDTQVAVKLTRARKRAQSVAQKLYGFHLTRRTSP